MNGLDKITGRIRSDAEAEAQRILDRGLEEAREVREDYAQRAETEARALREAGRLQADTRAERLESAAGLEGRKLLLAEKQKLLEETFALALRKLQSMEEDAYVSFLAGLLAKASATGKETVVMNAADRARVGEKLIAAANGAYPGGGSLTLSAECREMAGGFVLRDGPVEVNCSLETLLAQQKERASGQVAQALFGQAS